MLEDSQRAGVFNLRRALTRGFGPADYAGPIPFGTAPIGLAVSPDGRWLYATSEVASRSAGMQGTLSVISLPRAETDPAAAVVATVGAGCNPVRVVASADGREVWVTARASDDLLCFSAAALPDHPAKALVAVVRVGEAPVELMLVRDGSRVVVADSNGFSTPGATSDLSVVNVAAALAGQGAATRADTGRPVPSRDGARAGPPAAAGVELRLWPARGGQRPQHLVGRHDGDVSGCPGPPLSVSRKLPPPRHER
jgi:DNA-binding beta-propeller fold protein YncE